jgi:Tfp pilus assembly protein PilV
MLVTKHTTTGKDEPTGPRDPRARFAGCASERGDTLIEVMISVVVVGLIVVATLTGLQSSNRATTLTRARSQADALAQQDEDQLRSEPINAISELKRTTKVTQNGTEYTIHAYSTVVNDSTATESCNTTIPNASYLRTTSEVTSPSLGSSKVVETSIISPSPGSALIIDVTGFGEALKGATVEVTGPTNVTAETSTNGCAILYVLPGEYKVNVSKLNYVDENGYPESKEDPSVTHSVYMPAQVTTKLAYALALAGKVEVRFSTESKASEGDTYVLTDSNMSEPRKFGTLGTYATVVKSPQTVYPFPNYRVYAGTCESDNPQVVSAANGEAKSVSVPAGGTGTQEVIEPPVAIRVMSGTAAGSATEGSAVSSAKVLIKDTGCGSTRSTSTNSTGALPRPGLPYGSYTLCTESGGRMWEGPFVNETAAGPSKAWTNGGLEGKTGVIYLGTNPKGSPSGTSGGECK